MWLRHRHAAQRIDGHPRMASWSKTARMRYGRILLGDLLSGLKSVIYREADAKAEKRF